jgi:putative sporulation protein YtxC
LVSVQIGSTGYPEQVGVRLDFELRFLRDEGFMPQVSKGSKGPLTLYTVECSPPQPTGARDTAAGTSSGMVRHHLANAVSDLIVNVWEKDLVDRLVHQESKGLDESERLTVTRHALALLNGFSERPGPGLLRKIGRKGHVLRQVDTYLASHDLLLIEGFIRFRLREYLGHLSSAVEQALEEFMLQKEYREFVLLLRHFLNAQEPRLDRVHVVIAPDRSFKLLDEEGTSISQDYLEECVSEGATRDVNRDDLLISALITIAPREVKLHVRPDCEGEGLATLRAVFLDRLTTCNGCELCEGLLSMAPDGHERLLH